LEDLVLSDERTLALVEELRSAASETSCAEFKTNNSDADLIGRLVSALSNAARLAGRDFAYVVWGIRDDDHKIIGTAFDPSAEKRQKQPLEFWLAQRLNPSVAFVFKTVAHPEGRLVLLEIPAAMNSPVEFDGTGYVRIGSATPKLSDYPERLRMLWDQLRPHIWERGVALPFVSKSEVLEKLAHETYFDLTEQTPPTSIDGILERLQQDGLVAKDVGGRWNISNLGAILFARRLDAFGHRVARKAIRFVAYDGNGRADTVIHRLDGNLGYANGLADLVADIDRLLPRNEYIDKALRTATALYPPIAIRELIANALIHQDMTVTGAGPLIELFRDRLEITNPGVPLIDPNRFLDSAPRSRNEALAALMRRMRMCEEQGTGIDKVIAAVELFQLPPPDFRADGNSTRAVLYAPRRFAAMTTDERIRACYQHASLKFLSGERMKNGSLRERFGIEAKNAAQVSQVIRQALKLGLIRSADPERPQAAYLPFWA
jgi:ATP-dependent DNA helicase RecG